MTKPIIPTRVRNVVRKWIKHQKEIREYNNIGDFVWEPSSALFLTIGRYKNCGAKTVEQVLKFQKELRELEK